MTTGYAVNLGPDVRAVLRVQSWSTAALWLAVLLGASTALFVGFFLYDPWRSQAFEWALEHNQHGLAAHILLGEWQNLSWQAWATIGTIGSGTLAVLGIAGFRRCAVMMATIPGLSSAVREERARRNEQRWALIGCLLVLLFIPVIIAFSIASRNDE
jgi:hypothetical protein